VDLAFSTEIFAQFFLSSLKTFRRDWKILIRNEKTGIIFQRTKKLIRKNRSARNRRVKLEMDIVPRPTASMAKIKNGPRVKKSKTKARTKVEVAISNEKLSLLLRM
jgi:hypothetical protein